MDQFFQKKYDAKNYNCAHFVSEFWERATGEDVTEHLEGLLLPVKDRVVRLQIRRSFQRLTAPISPCIVVMHRPKGAPHVGVWFDGKVFHLKETGPEYQPINVAVLGFKTHRFYDVKECTSS